jgi:hypothetical protein
VDGKGLGITDVGKVGDELEAVDNLAASTAALDAEAEDTTEASLEVLLGRLVVGMALKSGVRNPADVGAGLEVLCEGQGVLGVALSAQAQGLSAEEELLSSKGVEGGTKITEDLDSGADDKGGGAESLVELEAVVAGRGLVELGEAVGVLEPVKLARVDDDTADGGAVSTDPLGGRVDDNIGAVVDGADVVTTSTEGVVNLRNR